MHDLTDAVDRASVTEGANGINLICSCDETPNNEGEKNIFMQIKSVALNMTKLNWFMKHIETSQNTEALMDSIIEGSAIAVSDRSYFPSTITCACALIIASSGGTQWIQGRDIIPGVKEKPKQL